MSIGAAPAGPPRMLGSPLWGLAGLAAPESASRRRGASPPAAASRLQMRKDLGFEEFQALPANFGIESAHQRVENQMAGLFR